MSDSWGEPQWSGDPNVPHVLYSVYVDEKTTFAGNIMGAICYGIVISLFFKCMSALLDPVNGKGPGIKWGLVAHTTVMFLFVTIYTAITFGIQSISFIDDSEFFGSDALVPGPIGYQSLLLSKAINIVPAVIFFFNNWLADGLVLYRCYIIYSRNYWAILLPALAYLASFAMGITALHQISQPVHTLSDYIALTVFGISYYSIVLFLNILLTFMVVARLFLHSRTMGGIMGAPTGSGGPYNAIIVILVESCALYSVTFLLFIGLWAAESAVANVFQSILMEIQVIAPFLITLRAAERSALTSKPILSSNTSSIHFGSYRGSTGGNETSSNGYPIGLVDPRFKTPSELGVALETTSAIGLHSD